MEKIINYLKYMSIFLIMELLITFIISLFNLLGLNSGITSIILFITNIILFFVLTFHNAFRKQRKGLLEGLILGSLFIFLMFTIKSILFDTSIGLSTIIFYIILIIVSILGGTMGVNKKSGQDTTTNS